MISMVYSMWKKERQRAESKEQKQRSEDEKLHRILCKPAVQHMLSTEQLIWEYLSNEEQNQTCFSNEIYVCRPSYANVDNYVDNYVPRIYLYSSVGLSLSENLS